MSRVRWPLPQARPAAIAPSRIVRPPVSGGTNWTITIDDSTGLADSQALDVGRAVTDSGGLGDSQALAVGRQVDDPAGLVDTTAAGLVRTVDDPASLGDSRALTVARGITDPAAPSDAIAAPYQATVAADSPVAWWHLDETTGTTFADAAGSNPLTITGSPTLGVGSLAVGDPATAAADFTVATMNYGEHAASATFNPTTLTVEALIRTTGLGGNHRIIEYGADSSWSLYYEVASHQLRFEVLGKALAAYSWTGDTARHHVAGTYNGTGLAILYVDGVEVGREQGGGTGAPATTTDPLRLAQKPTGSATGDGWPGTLDEVAIYSTVLAPATIAAHSAAAYIVSAGTAWTRTVDDPAGLVDATAAGLVAARTIDDPASMSDAQSLTTGRVVTDPAGPADSQSLGVARGLDDPVGLVDTAQALKAGSQAYTLDDPAGPADIQTLAVGRVVATDPAGLADTVAAGLGYGRQVDDPAGAVDSTALVYIRAVNDPAGFADAISTAAAFTQAPADDTGLADAVSTSAGWARQVDDPAGLVDAAAPGLFAAAAWVVVHNVTVG